MQLICSPLLILIFSLMQVVSCIQGNTSFPLEPSSHGYKSGGTTREGTQGCHMQSYHLLLLISCSSTWLFWVTRASTFHLGGCYSPCSETLPCFWVSLVTSRTLQKQKDVLRHEYKFLPGQPCSVQLPFHLWARCTGTCHASAENALPKNI